MKKAWIVLTVAFWAVQLSAQNTNSRWIQWVYGTGGTTILDATVDGSNRSFPFRSPVEKTPQPVEGPVPPMNTSMEIFIPDYYAVGDYFEVTLRNWNQCNPYRSEERRVGK